MNKLQQNECHDKGQFSQINKFTIHMVTRSHSELAMDTDYRRLNLLPNREINLKGCALHK